MLTLGFLMLLHANAVWHHLQVAIPVTTLFLQSVLKLNVRLGLQRCIIQNVVFSAAFFCFYYLHFHEAGSDCINFVADSA